MGLDTNNDAFHGSYSGFSDWRLWLADIMGWPTEEIKRYSGYNGVLTVRRYPCLKHRKLTQENFNGIWKRLQKNLCLFYLHIRIVKAL